MQLFSTIAPRCSSGQVLMLFRTHCHLLCFLLLKQCPFKIIYIYYKPFSIIQVPEASACKVRKAVLIFNIFEQQYAGKILACILDELCGNFSFLPWTWCKSRLELLQTVCLSPEYRKWRFFYHLSASCSKHSAILCKFIFKIRTSFGR